MSWGPATLDSLCSHTYSGGTPPTNNEAYYGGDIPWLRTQEVVFGRIFDTEVKITEAGLKNSAAKWVPEKSVIVAMYGNSAGRSAINEIPLTTNQACCNLVIDPDRADYRYVFYALLRSYETLKGLSRGAAQNNLNAAQVKAFTIPSPSVQVQRDIGDILSTYDDLIENNRRRMALLEESARLLYQEWFIRLRFPGYEHTPMINGVPNGWESCLLDDICKIGRGASPRPIMNFMGGTVPWFKIGDATASDCPFIFSTQELVTEDGAKKSILLEPGSLILSNSATCGIPYFTGVSGCVHDGWLHFSNFRKVGKWFLYCYLFFKRDELVNSVSDGSTQKNLNTSAVGRLKVVIPKNQLLTSQFEDAAKVSFDAINILSRQNAALRAARDLLLPRLMSGEITV